MGITQVAFARQARCHSDTAWRFAQAFGTTPEFWMNLQSIHDLASSRPPRMVEHIDPIAG